MSNHIYEGNPNHPRVPGEMVDFSQTFEPWSHGGIRLVSERIESYYQDGDPDTLDTAVRTLRGIDEHIPDQYAEAMLYASYIPVIVDRAEGTFPDEIPLLCTENNLDVTLKKIRGTVSTLERYIDLTLPTSKRRELLHGLQADVLETGLIVAAAKLSVDQALVAVQEDSEPEGLLFVSASRERNPAYYQDMHQLHTYNPDDPSARTRVHVYHGHRHEEEFGANGVRYNIVEAAREALYTANPGKRQSTNKISAPDVLDIVSARPDWNPSRIPNANLIRTLMAEQLHDLIVSAEPDISLLAVTEPLRPDVEVA